MNQLFLKLQVSDDTPVAKGQWSGLLLQGLSPGPVLGFSVNPRTVQNMKTDMAKTQNDHVTKQLQ